MAPCPPKRKISFCKRFNWRSSPCLKTSSPRESAHHPQNYLCLFNPIFFGLRGSESPEKNVQNHDPSGPTSGECWSIELTINCRFANDATIKKQQSRVKRQAKEGPETLPPEMEHRYHQNSCVRKAMRYLKPSFWVFMLDCRAVHLLLHQVLFLKMHPTLQPCKETA